MSEWPTSTWEPAGETGGGVPADDPLLRDLLNRPLLSCFSFDMSFEDDFFLLAPETFLTDSSDCKHVLLERGDKGGICMQTCNMRMERKNQRTSLWYRYYRYRIYQYTTRYDASCGCLTSESICSSDWFLWTMQPEVTEEELPSDKHLGKLWKLFPPWWLAEAELSLIRVSETGGDPIPHIRA